MKYRYFLPCMLAALLAGACSKDSGGEIPPPQPFVIEVSDQTTWTADVTWTPRDSEATYIAMVVEKEAFDEYGSDEGYIASDLEYFRLLAEYTETDFAGVLANYMVSGPGTERVKGLEQNTDYYAYAYGIEADGTVTTPLVKTLFRTATVEPVTCTFEFAATQVTSTSARLYATPDNKECTYFWDCVSREDWDAFGGDEGAVAANIDLIRRAVEIYQMAGYDKTFADFLTSGMSYSDLDELKADTEYVVFAFGLDPSGTATTALEKQTFRTEPVAPSSLSFTTEILSLTFNGARIAFTPSNGSETYFTDCIDHATYAGFADDAAFMEHIVAEAGSSISSFLTKGYHVVDATRMLRSDTRYVCYAFGYAGGITTPIKKVEFTTPALPAGGSAAVDAEATIEDGNDYYARDEIAYADYKDKAVVRIRLNASAEAAHWYVAVFKEDVSGYTDLQLAEMLCTVGYEDRKEIGVLAAWGAELPVAAVATDSEGRTGEVRRLTVHAEETAVASANRGEAIPLLAAPLDGSALSVRAGGPCVARAVRTLRQCCAGEIPAANASRAVRQRLRRAQ